MRILFKVLSLLSVCLALNAFAADKATLGANLGANLGETLREYPLGAGDDIRVLVFQNPDLTVEARVSESGAISYPLIGSVQIGGLSVAAAEKLRRINSQVEIEPVVADVGPAMGMIGTLGDFHLTQQGVHFQYG